MTALFWTLYCYCVAQRVAEMFLSRRNQRHLRARGFEQREAAAGFLPMLATHLGWFVAMACEAWLAPLSLPSVASYMAAFIFVLAQAGRFWVLRTLGEHWNVSVMAPSGSGADQFVTKGPYRYIRHPNYLVVVIEIAALPLAGNAICTATLFSLANALVLAKRIEVEEKHLFSRSGYAEAMGPKARLLFWPKSLGL